MNDEAVTKLIALGALVVEHAQKKGAQVAEVLVREGAELSTKVRLGEPELVEEAKNRGIGLRVIIDHKQASTYTNNTNESGLRALVEDAIELAALSEPDEFSEPPRAESLCTSVPDLDLYDPRIGSVDAETAIVKATAAEAAARAVDPKITNSEGATFARDAGARALVTSGGFRGGYAGSSTSIVVSPIGEQDGKMQTGFYFDSRRFLEDLEDAEHVGREAARRTLAKLGAKPIPSCEVPVVFDPDAGRALLAALFGCISGTAIYRRSSYLLEREGEEIASPNVTIIDDPLIPRAPGSRPFDGEGLPSRRNIVVENGVLKTFLFDTYSARKCGKESTGSAARGLGGKPIVAPTNFYLKAGERRPEEIIAEMDRGLLVTSMMGFGFNAVTGDFSRGAEGFWIEGGKKKFPVSGVTLSLNFKELFLRIDAVGSDLVMKTGFASPTFRVSRMTIAGT